MLKTMERLIIISQQVVEWSANKVSYWTGKSMKTALHAIVSSIVNRNRGGYLKEVNL